MPTPTINQSIRPALGLTGRGRAVVILRQVQARWLELTPSQQAECSALLERLSAALRREHNVLTRQPSPLPLIGRISA